MNRDFQGVIACVYYFYDIITISAKLDIVGKAKADAKTSSKKFKILIKNY